MANIPFSDFRSTNGRHKLVHFCARWKWYIRNRWENPSRSLRPGENSGKISMYPSELLKIPWIGVASWSVKSEWIIPIGV
jgi:hypothetical protein